MPTVVFHGHACFEIRSSRGMVLIDPFLTGNPLADVQPESLSPTAILVTHGHGDHLGDTIAIARRSKALVVSTYELASYCASKGASAHTMHIGGQRTFPFGRVRLTPALHGGGLDEATGVYSFPCGVLYEVDGKTIFHPGDTGLSAEFELLGRLERIDLALLPIGDNYTMGPKDAVEAARMLKPRAVVPMHYDTFDVIRQDPHAFKKDLETATGIPCTVLGPGESIEV